MDYTNSQKFADNIIDSVLSTLRDQKDDEQIQLVRGEVTFNPSVFSSLIPLQYRFAKRQDVERRLPTQNKFLVLGPYKFSRKFATTPQIVFGQTPSQTRDGRLAAPVVGVVSNYTPFIVDPMVWQYTNSNGEIDGFFIGLYVSTSPPRGVTVHTVSWLAIGRGSRYNKQGQAESWVHRYDNNDPGFLRINR